MKERKICIPFGSWVRFCRGMGTSSPARSMTNVGGSSNIADESLFNHLATELTFALDRKEETIKALNEDVMAALDKEVKALEADAWKFAAPRSQLHLVSRSGIPLSNWTETMRQELMQTEKFQKDETRLYGN
eukprot:Gb_41256 [translate_table: standard]